MPWIAPIIEKTLAADRFYLRGGGPVHLEHRTVEAVPWELVGGQLLAPENCRQHRDFEAWHVHMAFPLISVYRDRKTIYLVRRIAMRPGKRQQPELVATIDLARITSEAHFNAVLSDAVQMALAGTSRLPITSVESPLPQYALGQLAWLADASTGMSQPQDLVSLIRPDLDATSLWRLIEPMLRSAKPQEVPDLASRIADRGLKPTVLVAALHQLFDHLALSPYTDYAPNLVTFITELEAKALDLGAVIDLLSYMLRQLVRHLNAFDLIRFHNAGANYPDALFLDLLLRQYLRLIEQTGHCFTGPPAQMRRRALRQALLARVLCEGLRVPDRPTSPGENQRDLPAPFVPVPEAQLAAADARRRVLFAHEPTTALIGPAVRPILAAALADLHDAAELLELGTALFLDRPLGIAKRPGEADRTPLLSYIAQSRRIAGQRLQKLHDLGLVEPADLARLQTVLAATSPAGVPLARLPGHSRQGVVALEDAKKVALDFVFTQTTRSSLASFCRECALQGNDAPEALRWLSGPEKVLLIRASAERGHKKPPLLTGYDQQGNRCLELDYAEDSPRYVEQGGREFVEGGLCAVITQR